MALAADPIDIAGHRAPARIVFGPHETNLGRRRALSARHVAYYERRAAGGAGVIITETASVHASDWPYERAPLALECAEGWRALAGACAPHGTLLLAGIGHCGSQGSSAYSQSVLWAPSRVADAATREVPAEIEPEEIDEVVEGFAAAAALAAGCGLAGVEVDAGARSLLRQFHSGITNHRADAHGTDRLALTRRVLRRVREALGPDGVLALRLCCDELAPWAGVTPEQAQVHLGELAGLVDLVTVVRGGPYSTHAYRPGGHAGEGFNVALTRQMREAAAGRVPVVLQGSVVDPALAELALGDGTADLVEMTRAQIAEPRLVALVRAGRPEQVRPCVLCNQACCVRDARNPVVSCIGEPSSGYETEEATVEGSDAAPLDVLVVGGGPAGLECARVLASRGHRVRLAERDGQPGGALRLASVASGRERLERLTRWLELECRRLGVVIEVGREIGCGDLEEAVRSGTSVVLATGSRARGEPGAAVVASPGPDAGPVVLDALALLGGGVTRLLPGLVVVDDPVGGPIGVAVAEWLASGGREVAIVTQDQVVGTALSRSGDLAEANGRLQRAGVRRELASVIREVGDGQVVLEDVFTGERRALSCSVLVDCGHRVAQDALALANPRLPRAGDCVAPRTALEAVLEGRRRALEVGAGAAAGALASGAHRS